MNVHASNLGFSTFVATVAVGALAVTLAPGCAGGADGAGAADAGSGADGAFDLEISDGRGDAGGAPSGAVPDASANLDALGFDGRIVQEISSCHSLGNTAPLVIPTAMPSGTPAPALMGNTIVDGIYELRAVDIYPPAPNPSAALYWRTIQFSSNGTSWRLVDLAYSGANADWLIIRPSATVAIERNLLTATFDSCYTTSPTPIRYVFDATPTTVSMWFENTRTLMRYLRVN